MTETPDVVEESPYLRCHSLVTIEVDPDPDPDPQVQVVYLSAAGNAGMKWLRDTGKGRQLIKHIHGNFQTEESYWGLLYCRRIIELLFVGTLFPQHAWLEHTITLNFCMLLFACLVFV